MKDKKIDKYIKEQSSKLTKGLIDRRQFMMSVLATGVTLPIALSLADKAVAATPTTVVILALVFVLIELENRVTDAALPESFTYNSHAH